MARLMVLAWIATPPEGKPVLAVSAAPQALMWVALREALFRPAPEFQSVARASECSLRSAHLPRSRRHKPEAKRAAAAALLEQPQPRIELSTYRRPT